MHWLEALALIDKISEFIEQLRVLQSLTAVSGYPGERFEDEGQL